MRSILELLTTRLEGAEEDREIQKTCECSPETGMPLCDTCLEVRILRDTVAEITRLRGIVEPLEALLKRSSDGVIIQRRNAGAGVIEYMVDPDDSEHWDDTLSEALSAAVKGATDE